MALTDAQLVTLKAAILAETDPAFVEHRTNGSNVMMAAFFNSENPVLTKAWDKLTPVDRISDAIDDTKYTPADAPDGTMLYQNRALAITIKQMNLQTKILGQRTVDATKATVRAGLRDAVINIPAGVAGANVHPGGAGGVNVMNACLRPKPMTRAEVMFNAGTQTTGSVTGYLLNVDGDITDIDVQLAVELP